jgi:nucleoside-diphosphate-sugar epimerase
MKIVVTGALGHIGSRLIRELPQSFPEAEVVMIDDMMTQRYAALFDLPAQGRYRFIEDNITTMDLGGLLDETTVVVHLAAITDAAGSFARAHLVERNNLGGTHAVAYACAKSGARLLTLSSTSVYGVQKEIIAEDCSIDELKPQSPYAEIKLREEELVFSLVAKEGLRAVCCRFGTIFGTSPGMRFHTAVNKFCWQAVMRQPVTVWRTAYEQKRPYLDLIDAIRVITFIIQTNLFDGRIYNVLTVNETVRTIVDILRSLIPSLEVSFVDNPIMNQLSYEVSTSRIRERGFAFVGRLEEGIKSTVELLRRANGM